MQVFKTKHITLSVTGYYRIKYEKYEKTLQY